MLYYSTNKALPTTCKAYAALLNKAKRVYDKNLQPCIDWHTGDLDDADTQEYFSNYPNSSEYWLEECRRKGEIDAASIVLHTLFDDTDSVLSDADKRKICIEVTGRDPECDADWMW